MSKLLQQLMVKNGYSNAENVELKRQELAGAITRIVINEALAEAKQRAKQRDEAKQPPKIITDPNG